MGSETAAPHRLQVVQGAPEVILLGEHREGRGAAGLVGLRHLGGVAAGTYLPSAGRAALELGDDRQPGALEGAAKRPRLAARGQRRGQLGLGHRGAAAGNALAGGLADLLEDVHRTASSCERLTYWPRRPAAAPESIASRARSAPCASEPARPET